MHSTNILDADEVFRRNESRGTSIIPASLGKDYETTMTWTNDPHCEFSATESFDAQSCALRRSGSSKRQRDFLRAKSFPLRARWPLNRGKHQASRLSRKCAGGSRVSAHRSRP